MTFYSPSEGRMSLERVFKSIVGYVDSDHEAEYRLIIGTDSHSRDGVTFVTAIIIHRVGKGARYYYRKKRHRAMDSLRQRIYYETSMSLGVGSELAEMLAKNGQIDVNMEIHLDVGTRGETRELIREVMGMVMGSGFRAKIKPDSYGASKVADKHTK